MPLLRSARTILAAWPYAMPRVRNGRVMPPTRVLRRSPRYKMVIGVLLNGPRFGFEPSIAE